VIPTMLRLALWCGLWTAMAWTGVRADSATGEELARIKAVYLYHFATFTEWPEHVVGASMKEIRLCVTGNGEVEDQLLRLDGKELEGGRVLRIVRVRPEELGKACHMAFFGAAGRGNGDPAGAHPRGLPLLTVGDQPGFAQGGGMIEMFLRDDRVRMRINLNAVRAAGIRLSSKLLRLAEIVEAP
jgi:hypothetical protein